MLAFSQASSEAPLVVGSFFATASQVGMPHWKHNCIFFMNSAFAMFVSWHSRTGFQLDWDKRALNLKNSLIIGLFFILWFFCDVSTLLQVYVMCRLPFSLYDVSPPPLVYGDMPHSPQVYVLYPISFHFMCPLPLWLMVTCPIPSG